MVIAIIMNTAAAFAECDEVPNTGGPDDPGYDPNGCMIPLDTWVFALVAIGLLYAMYYLHKNKEALSV